MICLDMPSPRRWHATQRDPAPDGDRASLLGTPPPPTIHPMNLDQVLRVLAWRRSRARVCMPQLDLAAVNRLS